MPERPPSIGTPVETRDGERLGVVAEVIGDYLRINPDESDEDAIWLNVDSIDGAGSADEADGTNHGAVRSDFDRADLERHVVPVPPPEAKRQAEERQQLEQNSMSVDEQLDRLGRHHIPDS